MHRHKSRLLPLQSSSHLIIIIIVVIPVAASVAVRVPLSSQSLPPLPLKLAPALHRDLTAVELALVLNTRLLRLLARRFASISPREVVELPVCVDREHKIPDW